MHTLHKNRHTFYLQILILQIFRKFLTNLFLDYLKLLTKSLQSNNYDVFDHFIYDIKSHFKSVFLFKFVEKIVYILVIETVSLFLLSSVNPKIASILL